MINDFSPGELVFYKLYKINMRYGYVVCWPLLVLRTLGAHVTVITAGTDFSEGSAR